MPKLVAVRTNPETGRAYFGTVDVKPGQLQTKAAVAKKKFENEAADPHHPDVAILLTVESGSHRVYVAGRCDAADGRVESSVQLNAGDQILFCDFRPEKISGGKTFCYAGHRSVAGPNGATLLPAEVIGEVNLDELGWTDGLPE